MSASSTLWRLALVACAAGIAGATILNPPVAPLETPDLIALGAVLPKLDAAAEPSRDHDAVLEYPLFVATRRPWIAPPLPPPQAVASPRKALPKPQNYTLMGVIASGDERLALIKPPRGDKTLILKEGDLLDGWSLRRIGRDALHFESEGEIFELGYPVRTKARS